MDIFDEQRRCDRIHRVAPPRTLNMQTSCKRT
jgi:hypothetical protein